MLTKQDEDDVEAMKSAADKIFELYETICSRRTEPVHPSDLGLPSYIEDMLDETFEALLLSSESGL